MEPGEDTKDEVKARNMIAESLEAIADITMRVDPDGAAKFMSDRCMQQVADDPLAIVGEAVKRATADVGYLVGYLPTEIGNKALQLFKVKHPVFGDVIPTALDEALEMGRQIGQRLMDEKLSKAEQKRRAEQLKNLGITLPEVGEEVTADDAQKILDALRARQEAALKAEMEKARETLELEMEEEKRRAAERDTSFGVW